MLNSCSLIFGKTLLLLLLFNFLAFCYILNIQYISATIRSIPKHRNCSSDLEIIGTLKMFMGNATFREDNKKKGKIFYVIQVTTNNYLLN